LLQGEINPMNVSEYANNAGNILVLPDAVMQIKQLIDSDAASSSNLAELISFDPALTVQLLKIANSALYNFPNKIDSVAKSVQVIGTRSVYNLVLAYGVANAFEKSDLSAMNVDLYWDQSVNCAILSKYFADKLSIAGSERLFVAGLLHNIGELVVYQLTPDIASRCRDFNANLSPAAIQYKTLGFTYADVGAALIKLWGIPEGIWGPIENLHNSDLPKSGAQEDKILQLAYHLTLENVYRDIYQGRSQLDPDYYQQLTLQLSDVKSALDHTNLQAMGVLAMFNPAATSVY
jgi:HD-like signal output (HDOD) protein